MENSLTAAMPFGTAQRDTWGQAVGKRPSIAIFYLHRPARTTGGLALQAEGKLFSL